MNKVAIMTDSTAYIPLHIREDLNISMVPLNVVFGEEAFKEEMEITIEQFYKELKQKDTLPTTSQPAIGLFEEEYNQLAAAGYEDVIVITLSSGISGTYQTAVAAGNTAEGINVHVFDSEISCMVQGFYVLKAAKMANEGKTTDEILHHLQDMKSTTRAYFMVDDLNHLHRGGRLNGAQLIVGSLLQIKPVLHFENKVIVPFEKVRTAKKALNLILTMLDDDVKKGTPLQITVIHANRLNKANEIAAELRQKYPDCHIAVSYFGPVIGTHLGEGSIGIGWAQL
ncbi:EDD domain protein, DegV family [Evansella caseinilytica]|uniref:EDD domain protein, DegV family n=1 Tax=Evansella caseinilytica TaxID=1503961 RepID=A0A1H3S7Z4_9BACI|nr:DegV family protein [Evansella caseinilytica]SDZ33259.1 EDD domain protein, DegV family [Evansella caseinilytica]